MPTALRAAVVFGVLFTLTSSCALVERDVVIWKVGSPHRRSSVPPNDVPQALRNIAASRHLELVVDAFPAAGFQPRFRESQARDSLPDLLVFDNMGILTGFPPAYGRYEGIAEDPKTRQDFIRATGTFDALLGPRSGWTYLHRRSPHHARAKRLALTRPTCPGWTRWPADQAELIPMVRDVTTAYLRGERDRLRQQADPERLETTPPATWQRARVDLVQPCGIVALDRLAFAWVQAVYETPSALGHKPLLVVLRKRDPRPLWRALAVSQDPLSTSRTFLQEVEILSRYIKVTGVPQAATLLEPSAGVYPAPPAGQRFGFFRWRPGSPTGMALQIAEFAYDGDTRIVVRERTARPEVSAGRLWSTGSTWQWRVWTVSRDGDVAFSERRSFPN